MKKWGNLKIKTTNEAESRKTSNLKSRTPLDDACNPNNLRHQIKEYFPNKQYSLHIPRTQNTSTQITQPNDKSPPNSKLISVVDALSLLQKDEIYPISRPNNRTLPTKQINNIQTQDQVFRDCPRLYTQLQKPQPIIQMYTQHNSPKKSLKTSPDTKYPINSETFKNRLSRKMPGQLFERLEQIHQITSDSVRYRISNLKQNTRGNTQQIHYKFNNLTITNQDNFKEDIESKSINRAKPKLPQTSLVVLEYYKSQLTDFEQNEIKDIDTIYYLRPETITLRQVTQQYNNGFDTKDGDYIFRQYDHIMYRYEMLEKLGHGSFGQVFKVIDHKQNQNAAIKIIKNDKKLQDQAIIEIDILKVVNQADSSCCLVKMLNHFIFRNHVCIVFELLSCTLYEFIACNDFQGLELDLIRRFAVQILQALMYLSECNIIHCDLKPENILLKDLLKSGIKIIDFGSSCFINSKLYTYVQSRFYRAPEIILGIPYTTAIDMWSFGCIVAELFLGNSLFQSKNEKQLLFLQVAILGKPTSQFLDYCPKIHKFFNANYDLLAQFKESDLIISPKPLKELLQACPLTFYDFISKCLSWDPKLRMKPFEALIHPWIIEGLPKEIKQQHIQKMKLYSKQKNLDFQGQTKKIK
ncbi:unnamed protein product (macronuclear) [Paramecium tetraurelia]|uniref:Protein kinase domain-containing protein n=1 Tax=Paramecium tetraurelia TaxID=5888 RepID=A0BR87_PARTE|nr:uncharacterized protein GSPATT00031285001 [Paramecium tetraurelia]CAK61054.1 unnamed protein product [Paramecium tetraurelia]|eukprot:XP_001428452.1 hypothetical protein (macronuclear) [Paramecium tetraurelia strain d4-2]